MRRTAFQNRMGLEMRETTSGVEGPPRLEALVEQQEWGIREFLDLYLFRPAQRVRTRDCRKNTRPCNKTALDPPFRRQRQGGEVKISALQAQLQISLMVFEEFHLNQGKLRLVTLQEHREKTLQHLRRRADTQDTALAAREASGLFLDRFRVREKLAALAEKGLPFTGETKAASRGLEDRKAQLLFQLLYAPGQGWLAQVKPRRRAAQTTFLCDSNGRSQSLQVKHNRCKNSMEIRKIYALDELYVKD